MVSASIATGLELAAMPPPGLNRALVYFARLSQPGMAIFACGKQAARCCCPYLVEDPVWGTGNRFIEHVLNVLSILLAQDLLVELANTGLVQVFHKVNFWHRPF